MLCAICASGSSSLRLDSRWIGRSVQAKLFRRLLVEFIDTWLPILTHTTNDSCEPCADEPYLNRRSCKCSAAKTHRSWVAEANDESRPRIAKHLANAQTSSKTAVTPLHRA